jgi:hypothetical protein
MEQIHKDLAVDPPAKTKAGTSSVYVGPERYLAISKAALNVSNHIHTGRIITAGEMAQFLADNFLDVAWPAFAKHLELELAEKLPNGD